MASSTKPNDRVFYVYALLDTRKPGDFRYGRWKFKFEPFYIGKGCKGRRFDHLEIMAKGMNRKVSDFKHRSQYWKYCKIRAIFKATGEMPKVIRKRVRLTEQEAFDLERRAIAHIGRADLKEGPLINSHDGGVGGTSRQKCTKKTRKLISENSHRMHASMTAAEKQNYRKTMSDAQNSWWETASEREKEYRRSLRRDVFKRKTKAEMDAIRKRMSEGRKRYYASLTEEQREEIREKSRVAARDGWKKRRKHQQKSKKPKK